MKKIVIGILLILIGLFFIPKEIEATRSGITRASNGQIKHSYASSDQKDSIEFKYGISKLRGKGSNLELYGWGYIAGADSYEGYANSYTVQVMILNDNGKEQALGYEVKATNVSLDLTCASYNKDGSVFTSNSKCLSYSKKGTIVSHIRNGNKKVSNNDFWNNIYRNVGFRAVINLNTLKEALKEKMGYQCPSEAELRDPSCSTKNNCTWTETDDGYKCEFTKGKTVRIAFRLKLTTPSGATRNLRTFYRNVGVYNSGNTIDSSVNKTLSKYGFTMNSNTMSKKITTTNNWGVVRDSRYAYGNAIKYKGEALYVPATDYRTSVRTLNIGSYGTYPNTHYPSSSYAKYVFMKGLYVYGSVIANGHVTPGGRNTYPLLRSGSRVTGGYIPEAWGIPSSGKTILTVNLETTCSCLPAYVDVEEEGGLPTECEDETQEAELNDKFVINKDLNEKTYSTNEALNILLNANKNNNYVTIRYDADRLEEARRSSNYSSTATDVYCLKDRSFSFYGRDDILGALTLGEEDKNLYAGRYFRIDEGKMTANVTQTCVSTSRSALENVLEGTDLEYDLEYEPNALDTKMINNRDSGNVSITSFNGGYKGSVTVSYEMKNDRQYYFDYSKNDVVITPGGYFIDARNIYPIPPSTPANKAQDIVTYMVGDEKENGNNELGNDYRYTCDYSVVDADDEPDPEDPGDPNNPDDPGENISENENYYYRTISLSDVFPEHRGNRRPYNWRNVEIERAIEAKGNKIYAGTPQYIVTLTTSNMKSIRRYNLDQEENGGYLNNSLECIMNNGVREDCRSTFLDNIVEDNYAESFERNVRIGGN